MWLGAVCSARGTLQHRLSCRCCAREMMRNTARGARLPQLSNVQQRLRAGRTVCSSSMLDVRRALRGRYVGATTDAPRMQGQSAR